MLLQFCSWYKLSKSFECVVTLCYFIIITFDCTNSFLCSLCMNEVNLFVYIVIVSSPKLKGSFTHKVLLTFYKCL